MIQITNMSYTIDYWDEKGEHLGCSALLNFTDNTYTMEYLENMARDEMNRGFFPGAVDYQISEQEAVAE